MERLVPIARFYPNVLPSSAGLSFATAHTLNNLPLLVQQAQLSEIRRALLALDIFPSPKELQRVSERFDPVHGALSFYLDQKTFLFSFDVKVRDVAVDQFLVPMYCAVVTLPDPVEKAPSEIRAGDYYLTKGERESIAALSEQLLEEGCQLNPSIVTREFVLLTLMWTDKDLAQPILGIAERIRRELAHLPRRVHVQDITAVDFKRPYKKDRREIQRAV